MSVAASSPAWLTRRAEVRNSSCAGVSGFESGAGDAEASGPERGIREGSDDGGYGEEDWGSLGALLKTFEVSDEDWYAEEVLGSTGTVSKTFWDEAEVRIERLGRTFRASLGVRKS